MPRVVASKHYIYVPYKDKQEAKDLGARWDRESKRWFLPSGMDLDSFNKWLNPQDNNININEAIAQFSNALSECGLVLDGLPIMDGKIKRVRVNGDKGSEKSGAYVGYVDDYPAGYIENFKTGIRLNWKFKLDRESAPRSNEQIEAIAKEYEIKVAQRAQQQLNLNEKTAIRLKDEYDNAQILQGTHAYLKTKGIECMDDALKVDRFGNLLIPLSDSNGKMWSMQRISTNGNKIIGVIKTKSERENGQEYSARKKGCFYNSVPLDLHEQFYVCEGFATAKSIETLLGQPSIMAVDSGNLLSVCEALLEKYPHKKITICADNDLKNEVNTGLNAAMQCREKYPQISVIKPSIANSNISDFNDLMRLKGIAIARADIKSQIAAVKARESKLKNRDKIGYCDNGR